MLNPFLKSFHLSLTLLVRGPKKQTLRRGFVCKWCFRKLLSEEAVREWQTLGYNLALGSWWGKYYRQSNILYDSQVIEKDISIS